MQTLKEVARASRYQAMLPAAITERQALDAAIKRAVGSSSFVRSISAALAGVLTPDDGTCVLPPPCQQSRRFEWDDPRHGTGYQIRDFAGFKIRVHKSWHESLRGMWVVNEERVDGEGTCWRRLHPLMVIDDFGNLVEVTS